MSYDNDTCPYCKAKLHEIETGSGRLHCKTPFCRFVYRDLDNLTDYIKPAPRCLLSENPKGSQIT